MEYEGQLDGHAQPRPCRAEEWLLLPVVETLPVRGCGGPQTQCEQILSISM